MEDPSVQSDQVAPTSGQLTKNKMSQLKEETFAQPGKLQANNVSHAGKKVFVCTKCDKAFTKLAMKKHKLVHKGKNLVSCIHCFKFFSSLWDLKRHSLSHTREKLCNQCGKTFSWAKIYRLTNYHMKKRSPYTAITVTKLTLSQAN